MADIQDNSAELFGRQQAVVVRPITADMCTIVWSGEEANSTFIGPMQDGIVTGATNITISYQQQVVRRRSLAAAGGHPVAVIYPTQPIGSIQIQRLFADFSKVDAGNGGKATGTNGIFSLPGWNICNGTASLNMNFDRQSAYKNCSSSEKIPGFRMTGAVVTGYNIAAEAEGLTVVDNLSIEFLQMFQKT